MICPFPQQRLPAIRARITDAQFGQRSLIRNSAISRPFI
jgi:hypothetical protein